MKIDLIFDVLIICLLFPTIIYAVVLNHRLKSLRSNQEDFGKLIWAFNDATNRAEAGTTKLKQLAENTGLKLKDQVDKAHVLRDDLAYFLEKNNTLANKMEDLIAQSRIVIKEMESVQKSGAAIRPVERVPVQPAAAPPSKTGLRASIEESVNAAKKPAALQKKNTYADEDFVINEDERSEAEKELLKALQSLR